MTVILKFPNKKKSYSDPDKLPDEVMEWMKEHPECEELPNQLHYGYHILVFRDDWSATAFKLKFLDKLKK